ncbi:hypothetical protein C2G38_2161114 [Gigaspora rosea]|uniref:Uncharacterized protein n=1 Tax=Gigaspora rosea TaxID=44941 RepID=A0A397VXC6_9GLOM|nr:hypothetical protein C2G38_2161114 [Gigaspora rosea]
MEFAISFEHTEEFASIEFHNEDLVNIVNELAVELSIGSWNEFDHFELHNEDSTNVIDEPAIRQMGLTNVMDELTINRIESHNENAMDKPAVGKIFESWDQCIK